MMRILFERTGGLMGLKISQTINLDETPPPQAAALRLLLDEVNFFTLPENPPTPPVPDGYQYAITFTTEKLKHTVYTNDTSAPNELRTLIQELSQIARVQRKK
jgi:hypothetical protein